MPLKIRVNELPDWINLAAKSKNNVLVIGDPGVGKSQVIGSMANDDCKITMMTGSSTIEEYVNGIPKPDQKEGFDVLKYIAPEWLCDMILWNRKRQQEGKQPGMQVLFLDEFNTADPQVLKTFLTILSERRIPTLNIDIPDNVVLVAAMNPHDQNEGEPLIRPMASRFMQLEVDSSMNVYRAFLNSEDLRTSGSKPYALDQPKPLEVVVKQRLLDQINAKEWGSFDQKKGHEINPRSMSNFFRALEFTKDAHRFCANLSQAFLGVALNMPKNTSTTGASTNGSANGTAYLDVNQLENLDDNALQAYYNQINKSGVRGSAAIKARADARVVLHSRGLDVDLGA